VTIESFDRDRDLSGALDLVGRSLARGDSGALLHPGDLQWLLRRVGRAETHVGVLIVDAAPVGLAVRVGTEVILQAHAAHEDRRTELLAWVEGTARGGGSELLVSVADDDEELRRLVLARGYEASERRGFELVYDLGIEPGSPALPPGFEMLSLTPALTDRYIDLHRAAWARPQRPSTYDRAQHDIVTAMPDFRYDLVPIVAAPDGTLAAYCISWWDPRSSSVEIEPLGTHPDFRRLGLGRAIVHEVFRRSHALGAKYVLVWGSTANPEAEALYLSAGMRRRRLIRDYRMTR
jgi:ribosomal protein S18 acetylase RimI-like enzyme